MGCATLARDIHWLYCVQQYGADTPHPDDHTFWCQAGWHPDQYSIFNPRRLLRQRNLCQYKDDRRRWLHSSRDPASRLSHWTRHQQCLGCALPDDHGIRDDEQVSSEGVIQTESQDSLQRWYYHQEEDEMGLRGCAHGQSISELTHLSSMISDGIFFNWLWALLDSSSSYGLWYETDIDRKARGLVFRR